ncbi:MAG: M48 family metalloprotease [Steroidobacteraceae bacterium]
MNKLNLLAALLAATLVACGVNPVTGKKEIQFISEGQELQIGAENYSPTKQSQGGDFKVIPDLSAYMNEVGQKLAAVSDRKLPYEFAVLNESVPNAWALPGGKIAVNRGLLTELRSEAELAAVLGHEIVHAAARHGAKAQERGTLISVGMAAAQVGAAIGGVDQNLASLMVQGAGLGSALIQTRYGREQELEADEYGMKYMKAAGYDPLAAVSLQETFVRLSGGQKSSGWLEGLFASHPPSPERVARNKVTAQELGAGGQLYADRYLARIAPLQKLKPAYDKYDQAVAAAQKKDFATARTLTTDAAKLVPQEGRFQQMLGEIALAEKKPRDAIAYYENAIALSPDYFGSYLGGGVAQYRLGDKVKAEDWLNKSVKLLPTAPAVFYLGNIARDRGDKAAALKLYQSAAGSQSEVGKEAALEMARMDLPDNPGRYVAAALQVGRDGKPVVIVQNRAPVALADITLTPVLVNASGQIVQQGNPVRINGTLKAGESVAADPGIAVSEDQLVNLRFRIDNARIAE